VCSTSLPVAPASLDDAELERLLQQAVELQSEGRMAEAYGRLRQWVEARVRRGDRRRALPMPSPVEIPSVTLVCVDCRYYELAAEALTRSLAGCRFERALFFTDADVRIEGVETVRIPTIASVGDYSSLIIKGLDEHIDSDYALLIQYDGYVLHPACWSSEFLQYDYVGARWPFADGLTVGNGGFSLRSKRLLRALQDPEVVPLDPEDMAICRTFRPHLERSHGIRFAPDDVAERFAFETVPSAGPTFGFHGLGHLINLFDMSEAEIAAYRPPPLEVRSR
jgi:hypothetical protein